jgi:tryptophanyl-tRNA synthetase
MECTVSYGELSRMTQFKDKSSKREGDFISAGLFTYPALQAADIVLYDAEHVPVGEDQRQHVEITRDIALRFNHRFGETFVIPQAVTPKAGARVMDLQDPSSKMSKSADSDAGCIMMMDDPSDIARKFKRAVTDSDNEVRYDRAAKPGVSNLLEILAVCTGSTPQELAGKYTQYGPLKTDAGDAVGELLRPIQSRFTELMTDRRNPGRCVGRRQGHWQAATVGGVARGFPLAEPIRLVRLASMAKMKCSTRLPMCDRLGRCRAPSTRSGRWPRHSGPQRSVASAADRRFPRCQRFATTHGR